MISLSFQNWSKVKKPVSQSVEWPEERYAHAAAHITGPMFVMIGGYGDYIGPTLNGVWLCDTYEWSKVFIIWYMHNNHNLTMYIKTKL